jgi:hypothetical protein
MFRSLTLGGQAAGYRDLARRARRLADGQAEPLERQRLRRYAEDLEDQADRLEREATEARPLVIAPPANDPSPASN